MSGRREKRRQGRNGGELEQEEMDTCGGSHDHLSNHMPRRQSKDESDDHACADVRKKAGQRELEKGLGKERVELTCEDGDNRLVDCSDSPDLEVIRHPQRSDEKHTENAESP